jgi:phage shock protein C
MSERKLERDTQRSIFGGVCSGLAKFFSLDPTIVRVIFIAAAILGGSGVLLYVLLWIFIPAERIDVFNK